MKLEGLHHVTAITADAPRNVDFYAGLLGLRFVKKTVNFDQPQAYHLYYGDERGRSGSIMTFFEFPNARPGRPGAGMVHTVRWRVGSDGALAFWEQRLSAAGVAVERGDASLRFEDPEGLTNVLAVTGAPDPPLVAQAPDVPPEHALQGFDGVRAYAAGEGAGSVHHVAWNAADDDELMAWREGVAQAGAHPTPMRDRTYFHSVYFRTPAGVLFELATRDIGFHADEPVERLGEALKLPPQHEHLRALLEQKLTPLPNPRAAA